MGFLVTLEDDTTEHVDGADSYQQEGPMTTFFGTDGRRGAIDCWSVKLASFRTGHIVKIVREAPPLRATG